MRIAYFTTPEEGQAKLDMYNNLARHPTSPVDFTLANLNKHTTQEVYWFNFEDCVDNGGLGAAAIEADSLNINYMQLTYEELISQKYLDTIGGEDVINEN